MYHFIRTCFRVSAIALVGTMMPVGLFIASVQADDPEAFPDPPSPAWGGESNPSLLDGDRLRQAGDEAFQANDIPAAILLWQQALAIYRHPSLRAGAPQVSRERSGHTLNRLGQGYRSLGQYQDAIAVYDELLQMAQEPVDDPLDARHRQGEESNALSNLGNVYMTLEQYGVAIEFYQQALSITRELIASTVEPAVQRQNEATLLSNVALSYFNLAQYDAAIATYSQAISILQDLGDAFRAANALHSLGAAYLSLGRYEDAIAQYEQALAQARRSGNYRAEDAALADLRVIYQELGRDDQAAELDDQQVAVGQNMIDVYTQRLLDVQAAGDRRNESILLNNLANIYFALADYRQALTYYEQRLLVVQALNDRRGEANTYADLGITYRHLDRYEQSIAMYEQAVEIFRDIGDRRGAENALGNLGIVYQALGRYPQAIERYEEQQAIAQQAQDPVGEGLALSRLGIVYQQIGQYEDAIAAYQQSLVIFQASGSQPETGVLLSNIGRLLALQGHIELAIIFYKQSVNVREAIRGTLQGLPAEWQQSFTETVADDYRALADLLLQQDRVLEAQQVLDLLKVQELDDYFQQTQRGVQSGSPIALRDFEETISNRVIAGAYELAQLRNIPPAQLSDDQLQRLVQLDTDQRAMNADFLGFLNSSEVQSLVAQLGTNLREQDVLSRADEFINLQNNLRNLDQNAVLIYPLVLSDRLELVLVTPFGAPARYPVSVNATTLNAAIVEFRQALEDPLSDPRPIAQQLYAWLIEPMVNDLVAIGAETILYAPDGVLRYIPLAALHDGDQWLVETYRINHITAASLQNFTLRPSAQPLILAAAFSEGSFEVQIGSRSFFFGGLPFAGVEVENLALTFPNATTLFVNDRFSRSLVEPLMDSHTIVHLATHAAFVPGSPADSFILFGNGDRLSLDELNSDHWRGRFNRVELVVLSACETGVGDNLGNGAEILGFGYLMQEAGAAAAIASLWQVSDGGTQLLMNAFYHHLTQGMTKAEALHAAQTDLIHGDFTVIGLEQRADIDVVSRHTGLNTTVVGRLSHPYYWAPFILIGNGL
jgi:CHAT domain-containing protein/Flp pilus assembly protein TadD